MSLVNIATGEIAESITVADVDASIARVIRSAESIWDEWAWQVENQTWLVKGYGSWDEMRRVEYGALTNVTAPRAERPELVSRFRAAGLTQKETAETLGVSHMTVRREEPIPAPSVQKNTWPSEEVIDAELVDEEPQPAKRADADPYLLTLINDLRGPWRTGLTHTARRASPEARQLIINALQAALDDIKEI